VAPIGLPTSAIETTVRAGIETISDILSQRIAGDQD
jgi:hypothetical protein